jgi:hypothetical protein
LPGGAGEALTEAVARANRPSEAASLTAAILGIAAALWSASSGMVALQSGLNVAYDVFEDRKIIGKRGIALLLLLITILLGGVPSPFFTFGEAVVFEVLGWVLTIAAVIVMFSLFYYLGPNRGRPRWQWVSVGGIVGAVHDQGRHRHEQRQVAAGEAAERATVKQTPIRAVRIEAQTRHGEIESDFDELKVDSQGRETKLSGAIGPPGSKAARVQLTTEHADIEIPGLSD